VNPSPTSAARDTKREAPTAAVKVIDEFDSGESIGLFVGNIPPNTTDRDLAVAFREYGTLATIIIPKADGLSKGYAFVWFEDTEAAKRALQAKLILGGRHLVIRWKTLRTRG